MLIYMHTLPFSLAYCLFAFPIPVTTRWSCLTGSHHGKKGQASFLRWKNVCPAHSLAFPSFSRWMEKRILRTWGRAGTQDGKGLVPWITAWIRIITSTCTGLHVSKKYNYWPPHLIFNSYFSSLLYFLHNTYHYLILCVIDVLYSLSKKLILF